MVLNIIGFIVLVTLVMAVTCIFVFRSQFERLEQQMEEEYQKLYPVLMKRQGILSSFFSIEAVDSWGIEETFNQSVLDALSGLEANSKERKLVLANHNLLRALLLEGEKKCEEQKKQGKRSAAWQELSGYHNISVMEKDYSHAIKPLKQTIHTYNVLRRVFPASLVAKLLKKDAMEELH